MFQLSFAIPGTGCSFWVGQIPMSSTLLAGHWGLCVPSSKPLEVLSVPVGSQAILEQQDGIGREQEVGDLGSSPAVIHWLDTGCRWTCIPDYKMSRNFTQSSPPMACNETDTIASIPRGLFPPYPGEFFLHTQGTLSHCRVEVESTSFEIKRTNRPKRPCIWVTVLSFMSRIALAW